MLIDYTVHTVICDSSDFGDSTLVIDLYRCEQCKMWKKVADWKQTETS